MSLVRFRHAFCNFGPSRCGSIGWRSQGHIEKRLACNEVEVTSFVKGFVDGKDGGFLITD